MSRNSRTDIKKMCVLSLFAAMCVSFMALSSIADTLDISLAVAAGLVVAVADVEYGARSAWCVFAVAGTAGLFLPVKTSALFFIVISGWYPIIKKNLALMKKPVSLILKILIVNAALVVDAAVSVFVLGIMSFDVILIFDLALGNALFFLYDELIGRLILWYIVKIRPRLRLK